MIEKWSQIGPFMESKNRTRHLYEKLIEAAAMHESGKCEGLMAEEVAQNASEVAHPSD